MPDSANMSGKSKSFADAKPVLRTCVLALALLAPTGTLAYAQAGKPAPGFQNPDAANTQTGAKDPDKLRVQARWDAQPGSPVKKDAKTGKPGKAQTKTPPAGQ